MWAFRKWVKRGDTHAHMFGPFLALDMYSRKKLREKLRKKVEENVEEKIEEKS